MRYWLRKLFLVGGGRRCPRCEEGAMFLTFFEIHRNCPNCEICFQPYPGDSLGVVAVGYFFTLVPTLSIVILAFSCTALSYEGLFALYMFLTTILLLGFYPRMKGVWVAFVYLLTGLRRVL